MTSTTDDAAAAEIVDLSHDGRGVAELSGRRVFVAGALPEERVLLKTRKRRRRHQEAELIEVIEPAASRIKPACPYFGVCGGCAVQHLDYPSQLEFKRGVVAEALARIGRVEPAEWLPILSGSAWHYRRRARLGIKYVAGKGRVLIGFRERAAPYITDMDECRVLIPPMDRLPLELASVIADSPLRGRIPQAEISVGDDAAAVVLRVLDSPGGADIEAFESFGRRLSIDVYIQTGGPDSIRPVTNSPRQLAYSLPEQEVRIEFEPGDFIQINAEMNRLMVQAALESAELESSDAVLDLYSGLGNFSLPLARRVRRVLGVDGAAPLIARAARNARLNGIENAQFIAADLAETDWPFFHEPWDIVFLDPARGGAEAAVAAMPVMRPRRVVYVSCHPGTLARDASVLVNQHGFTLSSVRVLDMFPNTHHVEAIAVFDRGP